MAENKIPSGVGKKIVEALKKQAEIEIQPVSDITDNTNTLIKDNVELPVEDYSETITDNINLEDNFSDFSVENNDSEGFSEFVSNDTAAMEDTFETNLEDEYGKDMNFEETDTTSMFDENEMFNTSPTIKNVAPHKVSYAMPANVAVLKRLIMQLPQGVTKQTGVQIIRQTMEDLGISMNSVLKEAQQGQDSITASAKACLATIAEYKNNIKSLEKQVQDYKKQAVALNDLISLFVMTDRH